MNRIRSWLRMFFGFSRNETNAFILLVPFLLLSVFIMPVYKIFYTNQQKDFTHESATLDSIVAAWQVEKSNKDTLQKTSTPLFTFNPNKATKEELVSLGFTTYMATRLENYRQKGGQFNIKSDMMKLYGMDSMLYRKLYTWIDLPENKINNSIVKSEQVPEVKPKFDLNLADSIQLMSVYGIGSRLSSRIVRYRSQLGGFVSMNQLYEVYKLDTASILTLQNKSFIAESYMPQQVALNTASEKELASHPYIRRNLAKAITAYRFQHGNFTSLGDLKKITLIDEATFQKISPYLSLNP